MTAWAMFSAALSGVTRHLVRAVLSIVGILAGVASLVLMVGVAHSVGSAATTQVAGLGANLVVVYPSGVSSSGVQVGIGTGSSLTSDDVTALGNPGYVPDGAASVPTAGLRDNLLSFNRSWQTDVLGSTDQFASALGYSMAEGRFFNSSEVKSAEPVVVLGQAVVSNLFAGIDPVGGQVRINDHPFRVVGVFSARGYSGSYNQDDLAVVPINTAWAYVLPAAAPKIQQVFVEANSVHLTDAVRDEVTSTLLQRHHIINPALADFQVRTDRDLVAAAVRVGNVMKWMLAATAAVTLLAGAIGVMTLMLTTVRERTREIGIRRAVGAARRDILSQFLVEALILAVVGAVSGLAVGSGAVSVVGQLVSDLPPPRVTIGGVVVALGAAVVVGAIAGIYPALQASRLQPRDAVGHI